MTVLAALNRFGLGARQGQAGAIRDPREWLLAQLEGASPERVHPEGARPTQLAAALAETRRAAASRDREQILRARRGTTRIGVLEAGSCLSQRVESERPFVERWIDFWQNHLCISVRAKVSLPPLAGAYERDAIRAHALGRFESLLLASARHPAMLLYLDNAGSIGPRSPLGARAGRGLNENYARELLELHTLGVDGGYGQQDVQELARLLTGWTTSNAGGQVPTFRFVRNRHEPGKKTILGAEYRDGEREGERAIKALASHPSTARHIARKLATHFVADDPPPALVSALAESFQREGGDLRALARTLVTHPASWSADAVKFRTPQDWVVAVHRATALRVPLPNTLNVLQQLRHPMWSPQAPKGYGDLEREWSDPDSLLNRAEYARAMSRRWRGGEAALGRAASSVDTDPLLRQMLADAQMPISDRVALLVASPSFQWR
jgi:uncharacterized protein (DUF1800 family)